MTLKGLKKAVGDYKRANSEGFYSPRYGYMYLDRETGEVWTVEFYSLGHNSWKEYHSSAIVKVTVPDGVYNMVNVKAECLRLCAEYAAENAMRIIWENFVADNEEEYGGFTVVDLLHDTDYEYEINTRDELNAVTNGYALVVRDPSDGQTYLVTNCGGNTVVA